MRTLFLHCVSCFFVLLSIQAYSQTTGYSGTGGNIDVNYHRFVWTLNASANNVAGTVTTYFTTAQNSVSQITFDFTKASFNNASLVVKYHGSSAGVGVSFPSSGNQNILQITLPVTLPINTLDSVSISYAGTPPAFSTYGEGMEQANVTGLGNALYTLAESYGDDDFWPCKADMQDKIDSIDFIITVPSTQRAAANGVLVSDVVSGGNRTMTYKHRYPIASYLVAVAVAQYNVYNRTPVTINGTSVPIVYYIGSGRTPTAANFTTMDYCREDLVAFSNVFGDYPFKNEKYGMYEFGWGGGMEHQTFSAMSWGSMTSWSVVAHELAHQWFGDKVTFGKWNHLWLAEGFARYSEALAAELVPVMGKNDSTVRSGFKSAANNTTNRSYGCYIPDSYIANSNLIWNSAYGNTVYERGAMVVSMLRILLGDTKFFLACRNYLNDPALAYRSATTDDLRNHMQAVAGGYDLTPFFNSYVYGNGYPSYNTAIKWGKPGGNRISFKVTTQTKSTGSTVSYYYTPIALRVKGSLPTQDTVLVIYDQNGQLSRGGNGISSPTSGSYIYFSLNFTPVSVSAFDDLKQTLATGATPAFDNTDPALNFTTLDIKILSFTGSQVSEGNLMSLLIAPTSEQLNITLERSEDGIHFYTIGNMSNGTNTSNSINFIFLDKNVFDKPGNYYRVKLIDAQSAVTYSKTISIRRNEESFVKINPNPASNFIKISLPENWQNKSFSYIIYNSNGIAVKKEGTKKQGNDFSIFVGNLPAGNYNIEIISTGERQVTKSFTVIH